MKNGKFLLAGLVFMAALLLLSCATEKKFWNLTADINTVRAYDEYLAKYPKGKYVSEAQIAKQKAIEMQEFRQALALKSEDAYRAFLKKYPNSPLTRDIRKELSELLEQQAWEKAKKDNSFTSYGEYIRSYPRNPHAEEARKEIAKSYKLNDEEVAKVAKLQTEKPAEASRTEYIDKLIFTGANYLDNNANWIDRVKGKIIYDMLKKYDSKVLTDSMTRVVLIQIDRLKVLFLVVKLGVSGTQEPLNDLLMEYGDKSMAEDYLNSRSKELHDGGARWARAHGYIIFSGSWGSHRVSWGSF